MMEDEKLLCKLRQKQDKALEQAIKTYTPYLSTVLFRSAGSRLSVEDTEEIISDVFIVLWRNAEAIDLSKGTVRSYLAAVARNFAFKRLNSAQELVPLEEATLPEEDTVDDRMFCHLLWQSVMELGEPDAELFVRYYKYNEKLKEIAQATGLHLSTIKTKLSRGKRKLKEMLQNQEELQ